MTVMALPGQGALRKRAGMQATVQDVDASIFCFSRHRKFSRTEHRMAGYRGETRELDPDNCTPSKRSSYLATIKSLSGIDRSNASSEPAFPTAPSSWPFSSREPKGHLRPAAIYPR